MRLAVPLTFLGALLLWLSTFGLALGNQGKVVSSAHDLGVVSTLGVSACELCHPPHDASGESLWPHGPYPEDDPLSGLKPLCYSCHDGTVTVRGAYAFDLVAAQHPTTPGKTRGDCDMCHDPHVPDYGEFLLFPTGANLCKACHAHGSGGDHPLNVDAIDRGYAPQDSLWNPNDGDYSGARLWDVSGSRSGSRIKCLSCHTAHGAPDGTMLLTMSSRETAGAVFLCRNCHADLEEGRR